MRTRMRRTIVLLMLMLITGPVASFAQDAPRIPARPGDTLIVDGPDGTRAAARILGDPVIVGVIVLDDQTGISDSGRPKHWYPFSPGAWPLHTVNAQGDTRILFIYGENLPRDYKNPIRIESDDKTIEYTPLALATERSLAPERLTAFEAGWTEAAKRLDADTRTTVRRMDALLVTADLRSGVLPGLKELSINGAHGSWPLRFGDDRAVIGFAREITLDHTQLTDSVYLPERVLLEIRTETPFPLDEIPVALAVNDIEVLWNGQPTIVATRVRDDPTGEQIEAPGSDGRRRLVPKVTRVYQTPTIELVDPRQAAPLKDPGVFYLPVRAGDRLYARVEDPNLLRVVPPGALARVFNDPSERGMTWRHALSRAARADGYDIADWAQLPGKEAARLSSVVISNIVLSQRAPKTWGEWLLKAANPMYYWAFKVVASGDALETTRITVGEHAALLLFRDAFVRSLEDAAKTLDNIKGEVAVRGLRETLKPTAWDQDSPWSHLSVTCPNGAACALSWALRDSYLETTFGQDREAAYRWSLRAVEEGLTKYKASVRDAIAKAKALPEGDVKGLIELIGYGYEPLLPHVLPRLVRRDPALRRWVPDLNARFSLERLSTVTDAVRAREDLSKVDTQWTVLSLSAAAAPFIIGEGSLAAVIGWGLDAVTFGVSVGTEIIDFVRQREEIHFALGSSLVLGTDRLNEAELRKSEWFEILLRNVPQGHGVTLATLNAIPQLSRAAAWVRASRLLSRVEKDGWKAFDRLSEVQRTSVLAHLAEAKILEESGAVKAMTRVQRRAVKIADKLEAEAKASAATTPLPARPKTPVVEAEGAPGPSKRDKRTLQYGEPDDGEGTLKYGEGEGPKVGGGSQTARKFPTAPAPNTVYSSVDASGAAVTLRFGNLLGEGGYATVYELLDEAGNVTDEVVKIYMATYDELFGSGGAVVKNIEHGSNLLADATKTPAIRQLENLEYVPNAPLPYIKQKRLDPTKMRTFAYKNSVQIRDAAGKVRIKYELDRASQAEFVKDRGLREAVMELFHQIKEKGLIWEDAHLGNMFFVKDERGKWVAGILDQDRIIKFAERDGTMGKHFGIMEAWSPKITSLEGSRKVADVNEAMQLVMRTGPGPFYPDAEFFMEKMFEHKDWIMFDVDTRTFRQQLLVPEEIRNKFFPNLDRDAKPLNLMAPHWQRRSSLFLLPRLASAGVPVPLPFAYAVLLRAA